MAMSKYQGVTKDGSTYRNFAHPPRRDAGEAPLASTRYGLLEHVRWIDEIVHDVPYSPQLETSGRCKRERGLTVTVR